MVVQCEGISLLVFDWLVESREAARLSAFLDALTLRHNSTFTEFDVTPNLAQTEISELSGQESSK